MATQLEMVNKILARLREDTVSTVAESSYARLVATFINDAKNDLEDITTDWVQYRSAQGVTVLGDSATMAYTLTGTNERSWIPKSFTNPEVPLAYDVTPGEVGQLYTAPYDVYYELLTLQEGWNNPVPAPRFFVTDIDPNTGEIRVLLKNPSLTQRTWVISIVTPQEDLALDGTDNFTRLKLPSRAIELRALYYALNERGEEMGEPGGLAWTRSTHAMAAAIENNVEMLKNWEKYQFTNQERF